MALMISDSCINCGYCERECPEQAVFFRTGAGRKADECRKFREPSILYDSTGSNAGKVLDPGLHYYIDPARCSECADTDVQPYCVAVCPDPASIVPSPRSPLSII